MQVAQEQNIPKLVIKKVIRAKRDRVFEAWTNPKLLEKWLLPPGATGRSTIDLRVGGKYTQDMTLGAAGDGCASGSEPGQVLPHEGEYLEIRPPEKLVFTWNTPFVQNTRVTVELFDRGETTELWLTHELLTDEKARNAHSGGWEVCLDNLEQLLN